MENIDPDGCNPGPAAVFTFCAHNITSRLKILTDWGVEDD